MNLNDTIKYLESIRRQYGRGDFEVKVNGQSINDFEDFIKIPEELDYIDIINFKEETFKYGLNLLDDLKHLYGENYREVNEYRHELFDSLKDEHREIRTLGTIIQNPVPVTKEELDDWIEIKNTILDNFSVSKKTVSILVLIESFVKKYHLMEED